MLKNINKEKFEEEVLKNDKVVLVDFYATWCPPCKMLAPVLEKIANSRVEFDIMKVNIDESQDLAIEYEVEVVPTMKIFKEGKEVETIVGSQSESTIVNTVNKYL